MDKRILSELRAAIKEEQTEAQNEKTFETCAKVAKGIYSAYIDVGFTEKQALYLTATFLIGCIQKDT